MKVRIKKLGNVEFGEFDISKKLTVFCGPNNTGKTYVSYLLYSLIKTQYIFDDQEILDLKQFFKDGVAVVNINEEYIVKYRQNKIRMVRRTLESIFGISDKDKLSLFSELEIELGLTDREFLDRVNEIQLDFVIDWAGTKIKIIKEKDSMCFRISKQEDDATLSEDIYF